MRENPIGVFDSGVGGLFVLNRLAASLPSERFIYLADEANMPYGAKRESDIKRAACACADTLFAMNCKAVVVACNTATAVAVDDIRRLYPNRIVIGLEPAIKPCCNELGKNGYAVALVTPATAQSQKFKRLCADVKGRLISAPQPLLARMIEDNISDLSVIEPHIREILSPYKTAESVILGCSHYSCIAKAVKRFYGGRIKIYDGADGAAARLTYCLALAGLLAPADSVGSMRFLSTGRG